MKCLIIGGGFIASHLVEFLAKEGHEVTVFSTSRGQALAGIRSDFNFLQGSVLERSDVGRALDAVRPEVVFHLAAQSLPGVSWEQPAKTFDINVQGTIGVFEEIRARKMNPSIVVACSSSEYAPRCDELPIAEDGELLPSSPYAASKLAQDHVARLYHQRYGLRIVRCRPFYLIGPRKNGDFSSDFARGIIAIERGRRSDLPVGNLDVVRDLLDVGDGAAAFWLLSQRGQPGEVYNICSGTGYSLREVLSIYRGLAKAEIKEWVDASRIRPIDEMVKIGNPSKLAGLGWSPRRPIAESLGDILDYWRLQEDRE